MYDMNFFSVYKNKQSKGSSFKAFLIILIMVFVILNGAMIGGGIFIFNRLDHEIEDMQQYISDPKTQEQVTLANKTREQANISNKYLGLIQSASLKLDELNQTDTDLFNLLVGLTPNTTQYTFFEVNGTQVIIECRSTILEDPIDMYHAFQKNGAFSVVSLAGITHADDRSIVFSFICQLAGGNPS